MTRIRLFRDSGEETFDDVAAARDAAVAAGGVAWIDVLLADERDIADVASSLGWTDAVARVLKIPPQRARLETDGDTTVVVMMPARYLDDTETVQLSSLGVLATEHVVVTIRGAEWVDLGPALSFVSLHSAAARSAAGFVWAVCATVLSGYGPVVEGVEQDIDQIEEQLFDQDSDVSRRIFALQRELIRLEHATEPLAEILDDLAAHQQSGRSALATRFRTSADTAQHVHRRVAGFRQTLDNALTVHATLVGEQSNVEMKRMTEFSLQQNEQVKKISSWAAIGFAPSLVAGIYGMNFRTVPELHWVWGYPFALALVVAVGGALYAVFKRHGWL